MIELLRGHPPVAMFLVLTQLFGRIDSLTTPR
jgi:hypothetical protein